jgi:hypothetical protein
VCFRVSVHVYLYIHYYSAIVRRSMRFVENAHISLIIHILKTSDKFATNFMSWSVTSTTNLDSIVVTLQEDAIIDTDMLHVLYAQYPGRIRGPFLKDRRFIIEFMKTDFWQLDENSVDVKEPCSKRIKHTTTENVNNPTAIDNVHIKKIILENIRKYNSNEIGVGIETTGNDVNGSWLCIPLENVECINIGFTPDVITNPCLPNLKVLHMNYIAIT